MNNDDRSDRGLNALAVVALVIGLACLALAVIQLWNTLQAMP